MPKIYINFTDKNGVPVRTWFATEIKTGLMDRIYELADESIELKGFKAIAEWRKRAKAVLVDIFHKEFTYEELQEGVSNDEFHRCFFSMLRETDEAIEKNSEGE